MFLLYYSHLFPFNSRPHEEVDLLVFYHPFPIFFFQLTTSRRGRRDSGHALVCDTNFQLTTSRRGRRGTALSRKYLLPFNSRPHEEVDSKYPQLSRIFASAMLHFIQTLPYYLIIFLNLGLLNLLTTNIFGANPPVFSVHSTSALED